MDPEIIQGGLMENLGMDEGTAYRYAAVISASPELYGDVLAKIGLSDGFQTGFRAANPRPAPYDPEAERKSRQRELDAYQDPIRKWAVETLTGFGVPAFTQYNLLGAAEMAPGLGDVIDVQDAALAAGRAYDNPTLGNIGEAAGLGLAAGVGAIPLAGDVLGPLIKTGLGLGTKAAGGRAIDALTSPSGIRAYHGSPHDFDKFSMSKIGTGEGAQAYGHGLYFAEAEDVARAYRDSLSSGMWEKAKFNGTPVFDLPDPLRKKLYYNFGGFQTVDDAIESQKASVARYLDEAGGDVTDAIYQDELATLRWMEDAAAKLQLPKGRMYEVNIKANPEDFLDWDKPLSEQPRIAKIAEHWANQGLIETPEPDDTVGQFIKGLHGGEWMQREFVNDGIPGIRYLDAKSRAAGEGSRNYVVFDEDLIEIVKKYGIAGAAVLLGVSALDVEQAIAENVPQSEWDSLVVGQ